jgi:RNA binding exosome subunit
MALFTKGGKNMKTRYDVKVLDNNPKKKKITEQEEELKDLLGALPVLKKHGLEGNVIDKVRQLRNGRKTKAFNLVLSRVYNGETITVKAPVNSTDDRYAVIRELKNQIKTQIQKKRKEQREMTKDSEGNVIPVVEDYNIVHGFKARKQDTVFVQEGSFLKALMKKIREQMTKGKAPTTKDLYVGIEIELAAKEDRNVVCDMIFDAGLGKYVTVKDDGSIGSEQHTGIPSKLRDTHKYTHEICILARQSEVEEVVNKLCKVFAEKLNVAIDKTCGLHVHLDMRNRDVKKSFNNLVLCQQFLYGMLPPNRRTSRYSYPVKGPHWRDLESRYHGINQTAYGKYSTLELRMHCGTTNATKINNWIKLLVAIVDAPMLKTAHTNVDALAESIALDKSVTNYVKSRIAKFEPQHAKTAPTKEEPGTMPNLEKVGKADTDSTQEEASEVA